MWPSKINKISEHKFQSLLYPTSNTKFQNVFLEHVVNILYVVYINKKKMGQKCKKKQLFMEIESLTIDEKVHIFKICDFSFLKLKLNIKIISP